MSLTMRYLSFLAFFLTLISCAVAHGQAVTGSGGVTATSCSNGIVCSPTTGAVGIQQDGTLPTLSGNNTLSGQQTLSLVPSVGQSPIVMTGALVSSGASQSSSAAAFTYNCQGSTQPTNWNYSGTNGEFLNINVCSANNNTAIIQAWSNGNNPQVQIFAYGAAIFGNYVSAQSFTGQYFQSSGSHPSNTGSCSITGAAGGYTAGFFTANGACVSGTLIFNFGNAAAHGYICDFHDLTTPADAINQTATYTTTTINATATMASGDVVGFKCMAG